MHHLLPVDRDVKLESELILMYAKCGEPRVALREWERVANSTLVPGMHLSWNSFTYGSLDDQLYSSALTAITAMAIVTPQAQTICDRVYELIKDFNQEHPSLEAELLNTYARCTVYHCYSSLIAFDS